MPPSSSVESTKRPEGVPFRILPERAVGVPSSLNSRARFWLDTVGGLLLCGGIVQRQLFPHFLLRIGDFTPFGGAKALIAPIFGAPMDIPALIVALAYTVIAIFAIYVKLQFTLEGRRIA